MHRTSLRPVVRLTSCLTFFGLLLAAPQLPADSGITHGSFRLVSGPVNPPPDQTVTTTWAIDISNNNDVCDERVLLQQDREIVNDPANRDLQENLRNGVSKFDGFKLTLDGEVSNVLQSELEDEKCPGCARPPLTVFFDITTGENALGCDFRGFEQKLQIRDIGLFCFLCCDSADELPAEPPTPYAPTLSVNAATTNAAGTGTIYGWVSRSVGGSLIGQQSEVKAKKIGTCVQGAPDNLDTYDEQIDSQGGLPLTQPTTRGCYAFKNIPFGNYSIRARADGAWFAERNINITASTPVVINICDGASCPSNPSCVP